MTKKNVLIICQSIHHHNTLTIAKVMGEVLDADIKRPAEIKTLDELDNYSIIGFGSGIYWGKHHVSLMRLVDRIRSLDNKKVFIFSTSGINNTLNLPLTIMNLAFHFHSPLKRKLMSKSATIVAEFSCRGYDTYGLLGFIGGISKGKPAKKDLENARSFARDMKKMINP